MHEDALIALIWAAFDGVPPPGPGQRDLFEAEAADLYGEAEPHPPHPARWQDLPDAVLEATPCALSYLDPEGLRYALPAVLCAELRAARDDRPAPAIAGTVGWHLMLLDPDGRDHTVWQLSALNREQRAAVAAWVAARGDDPELRAAWARLAAAEDDGARADWAELLFPPRPLPAREAVAAELWAAFPPDHPWRGALAETLDDPARPSRTDLARRLHPDLRSREKAAQQAALAGLDWAQRQALSGLVARSLSTAPRQKWARLTEAEAAGPRADWLDILFAPPPE